MAPGPRSIRRGRGRLPLNHKPVRTAVLISGSGTNLQAFIDRTQDGSLDLDLCVVLSNRSDAAGLERARDAGIAVECVDHRNFASREEFDAALVANLDPYDPELIILAGFMRILTRTFIDHFAGRIFNIHPSLLPKYPGLDTHGGIGRRFFGVIGPVEKDRFAAGVG